MIYKLDGNPYTEQNKPYDDDYMTYDELTGHYVLTPRFALERYGLELQEDVNERNSVNQQIAVQAILRQVSNIIYNFIHGFSVHNKRQDYIIATNPHMRHVIMQAMGEQLLYMSQVGDLSRSTDPEKRKLAVDENAQNILINSGICYCGV